MLVSNCKEHASASERCFLLFYNFFAEFCKKIKLLHSFCGLQMSNPLNSTYKNVAYELCKNVGLESREGVVSAEGEHDQGGFAVASSSSAAAQDFTGRAAGR